MSDTKTKGLLTPEATLSYPWLFTPQEGLDGGEPKYSASFIFDEEAQGTPEYEALRQAAAAVIREKWGAKPPKNLRNPFRDDGEEKGYPEGSTFIGARTKHAPGVVAWNLAPITDESEIYPGAIVRAQVSVFAYDVSGNRGVSFALDNVQKLRDGDRLDGRIAAKNAFTATEPPAAVDFSDIDQAEAQGASADVNDELAGLI